MNKLISNVMDEIHITFEIEFGYVMNDRILDETSLNKWQ